MVGPVPEITLRNAQRAVAVPQPDADAIAAFRGGRQVEFAIIVETAHRQRIRVPKAAGMFDKRQEGPIAFPEENVDQPEINVGNGEIKLAVVIEVAGRDEI